MSGKKTPW